MLELSDILGCKVESFPTTYLSLFLGSRLKEKGFGKEFLMWEKNSSMEETIFILWWKTHFGE